MYIDSIELRNVGPHRELNVQLKRGLIGIVGRNGAGKSTLINSIYAALTGDFTRFSANKAGVITADTTDPSLIKICGTHHQQPFVLIRSLRPSKSFFKIGSREYSKANDINAAIAAELNISSTVIDHYVFVDQWQMFSFLTETYAERAKVFQYLCRADAAARAHKICSEYLQRHPVIPVVNNLPELFENLETSKARQKTCLNVIKEFRPSCLTPEQADDYTRQLFVQEQLAALELKLSTFNTALAKAKANYDKAKQEVVNCKNQVTQTSLEAEAAKLTAQKAQAFIAAQTAIKTAATYHSNLVARQNTQTAQQLKIYNALVYAKDKRKDPLFLSAKALQAAIKRCSELEAVLSAHNSDLTEEQFCGYCQQPISEQHIKELQQTRLASQKELDLLSSRVNFTNKLDSEINTLTERNNLLLLTLAETQQELASISASAAPAEDTSWSEESAKRAITSYNLLCQKSQAATTNYNSAVNFERAAADALKAARANLNATKEKLKEKLTASEVAAIKDKLATHIAASEKIAQAQGAAKEAENTASQTQQLIEQLQTTIKQNQAQAQKLAVVEQVVTALHVNQLPRLVIQSNLARMTEQINTVLQGFNNPFVVQVDDELSFDVFLPGYTRPVKAKQLSGGQKVLLAVAFRVALDSVFGRDVGMMFLDEPTAGLDADNVTLFQSALRHLSQQLGAERQLVVVTHVEELCSTFDQLIEIT